MNSSQLFKVIGIAAIFAIISFVLIQSAAIAATPIIIALIVFIASMVTGLVNKPSSENNNEIEITTLYVGNLPYRANEAAIRELFSQYTSVQSVRLMKDKHTGKRRGFGFVEILEKDAEKTIEALNDQEFQQRTLKVREAKERPENKEN